MLFLVNPMIENEYIYAIINIALLNISSAVRRRNKMNRSILFGVRLNDEERRIIERLAEREERTPSDVVRRLIRKEARSLEALSPISNTDRPVAQAT
jgi:hypothetical protein